MALLLIVKLPIAAWYHVYDKFEQVQPRYVYIDTFSIKVVTNLCAHRFLDVAF